MLRFLWELLLWGLQLRNTALSMWQRALSEGILYDCRMQGELNLRVQTTVRRRSSHVHLYTVPAVDHSHYKVEPDFTLHSLLWLTQNRQEF